jgi:linker histone H1 and H5 family
MLSKTHQRRRAAKVKMSYKAGITSAITELKDRNGSSMIAIKKHMQGQMAADKKWMNSMFLLALKNGVASGEFVQTKVRFLSSSIALQLYTRQQRNLTGCITMPELVQIVGRSKEKDNDCCRSEAEKAQSYRH